MFAGRRWVATRELRSSSAPVGGSSVVEPPDAGCYISLYWITRGHEEDNERWSYVAMDQALMPYPAVGSATAPTCLHRVPPLPLRAGARPRADAAAPRARTPAFAGLLVEVVDAPLSETCPPSRPWLRDEHLPGHLAGSPAGMVLAFTPVPFSQGRIEQPGTRPWSPPSAWAVSSACCGSSTATRTRHRRSPPRPPRRARGERPRRAALLRSVRPDPRRHRRYVDHLR